MEGIEHASLVMRNNFDEQPYTGVQEASVGIRARDLLDAGNGKTIVSPPYRWQHQYVKHDETCVCCTIFRGCNCDNFSTYIGQLPVIYIASVQPKIFLLFAPIRLLSTAATASARCDCYSALPMLQLLQFASAAAAATVCFSRCNCYSLLQPLQRLQCAPVCCSCHSALQQRQRRQWPQAL